MHIASFQKAAPSADRVTIGNKSPIQRKNETVEADHDIGISPISSNFADYLQGPENKANAVDNNDVESQRYVDLNRTVREAS